MIFFAILISPYLSCIGCPFLRLKGEMVIWNKGTFSSLYLIIFSQNMMNICIRILNMHNYFFAVFSFAEISCKFFKIMAIYPSYPVYIFCTRHKKRQRIKHISWSTIVFHVICLRLSPFFKYHRWSLIGAILKELVTFWMFERFHSKVFYINCEYFELFLVHIYWSMYMYSFSTCAQI